MRHISPLLLMIAVTPCGCDNNDVPDVEQQDPAATVENDYARQQAAKDERDRKEAELKNEKEQKWLMEFIAKTEAEIAVFEEKRRQCDAKKERIVDDVQKEAEVMEDAGESQSPMDSREVLIYRALRKSDFDSSEIDNICRMLNVPSTRRKQIILAVESWHELSAIAKSDTIVADFIARIAADETLTEEQETERQAVLDTLSAKIDGAAIDKKRFEVQIAPSSVDEYERCANSSDHISKISDELRVAGISDIDMVRGAIESGRELHQLLKIAILFGHDGAVPEFPAGAVAQH